MKLDTYSFRRSYSTSEDNLLSDFYVPALERSSGYDRAAGFFSSGLLSLAPIAFSRFVENGGSIRLICSPNFSATDIAAVRKSGLADRVSRQQVIQDLTALAQGSDDAGILATLLSSMIASGILDLRIAVPESSRGLFHDKVGIFTDGEERLSFVGSANETLAAWSGFHNHEQIEVFSSWANADALARTRDHQRLFNEIWSGVRRGWRVLDPSSSNEMVSRVIKPVEIDVALDLVRQQMSPRQRIETEDLPRPLLDHQIAVMEDWERHGRRGIVSFATGGGKTLAGIEGLRRWTQDGKPALVLVPSTLLHGQWALEMKRELPEQQVVLLGAGNALEGRESLLRNALSFRAHARGAVVLSTYGMASRDSFLNLIPNSENILLCADEVHNIGATQTQNIMQRMQFGARLGLSATPGRKGSLDETVLISDYFGPTLEPRFTIRDAIAAKRLVPYNYFFRTVSLLPDEEDEWHSLTAKIRKILAMNKGKVPTAKSESQRFRNLLIKRAAVVKGAARKIPMVGEVLSERLVEGDRWLVYCQNQSQMDQVRDSLPLDKYTVLDYHQAMSGDSFRTLEYFTREGGVMLAIKCLDEGVDIPQINRALILASSTNPREYIQRRGRVLRVAPNKYSADIYDVLVTDSNGILLTTSEAERALEFASEAQNSATKISLKMFLDGASEVHFVADDVDDGEVEA